MHWCNQALGKTILDYYSIKDGNLYFDGYKLSDIASHGTPVYVYSERRILENIERVTKSFHAISRDFEIKYAVKACSIKKILEIMKTTGIGADVASPGEIYKCLRAGFAPSTLVYNAPGKSYQDLEYAVKSGVGVINNDSFNEAYRLNAIAKSQKKIVNTGFRVLLPISGKTSFVSIEPSSKFGVEKDDVINVYRKTLDLKNLRISGVHTHIGSQLISLSLYKEGVSQLVDIAIEIMNTLGIELQHVNIGGGLPVDYTVTPIDIIGEEKPYFFKENFTVENATSSIASSLSKLPKDVVVYIEPGRRIVADAAILLSRVMDVKERANGEKWVILDAGSTVLPTVRYQRWYYPIINISRINEYHDTPFRIGGPLCESGDVYHDLEGEKTGLPRLPKYRFLPASTRPGDLVAILHVGGYNIEAINNFNGRLKPPVYMIRENGELELIRRGDTYEDLLLKDL